MYTRIFDVYYQTTEHRIQENHDFYNHNLEKFRCHTTTTNLSQFYMRSLEGNTKLTNSIIGR